MKKMNKKLRALLDCCLLVSVVILLSGCLPDFMQAKAEYSLAGLEENKPLMKEVSGFLEERAAAIDTAGKKDNDSAQKENYQEMQLREDLLGKLASSGYYDSTVTYAAGARPWTGTYTVNSGQRYKIRKVSVAPEKFKHFPVSRLQGRPLDAGTVLAVQEGLYNSIAKGRCFFNLAVDHEVTLDRKKKTADILFTVTAGPQAKMGPVLFEGNERVKNSYLQKLVDWKEGDCFRRENIENLRTALFESGLFASAEMIVPEKLPKDGRVPVTLRVKERAARSLQAGVSYYTDEGLGLTLGWKHRNLFGAAESLDTGLKLSQNVQTLEARLTKPFFLRRDQSLSFTTNMAHEETDGYLRNGMDVSAAIKRAFSKSLSGSTGVSLSISEVKDDATSETNNFYLLSLPQSLTYDKRNNVLDATKGFLLDGHLEPFFDAAGQSSSFLKTEISAQAYHAVSKKMTAAIRLKAGSILGPNTLDIPAPKRFYAGGGGSVRGFGYQEVGPQRNGEPAGGRSVAEASVELRFRLTDTLGFVAFIDAGNVGNTSMLNLKRPSVGGGGGFRYYTDFAPLRLDVGVPLTNKETASSGYQLYVSIGQAF